MLSRRKFKHGSVVGALRSKRLRQGFTAHLCQIHSETALIPLEGRRGRAGGECRDSVVLEAVDQSLVPPPGARESRKEAFIFPPSTTATPRSARTVEARRQTRTQKPGAPSSQAVCGSLESCRDVLDLAWHAWALLSWLVSRSTLFAFLPLEASRLCLFIYLFYFHIYLFLLDSCVSWSDLSASFVSIPHPARG